MIFMAIHSGSDFQQCHRFECLVRNDLKLFNKILLKDIQLTCSFELDEQLEYII